MNSQLTANKLRALLSYEPSTGVFRWRVNRTRGVKAGDIAGRIIWTGYRQISVLGRYYAAHRLAWLYVYDEFPAGMIDHVNGDRSDNRISNLRVATNSQNQANRKVIRSRSGLRGVTRAHGGWQAGIKVQGKNIYLGMFATAAEAHAAYTAAAKRHFGEFAA